MLTVSHAFQSFRSDAVDLSPDVVSTARASRDFLVSQIDRLASQDVEFPRITKDFIPFGSFARSVKIAPLDDVDLMVKLHGGHTRLIRVPSTVNHYLIQVVNQAAPLSQFAERYGLINSIRVVNRIRDKLSGVYSYRKAEIH